MRGKIFVGAAAACAALCLGVAPAAADDSGHLPFVCNTTVNGGTINRSVRVPTNGVCVLNGVAVDGTIRAGTNAYLESDGSTVSGSVVGDQSLTLYIWNHSVVGGDVAGSKTPQVFVYDSTVRHSVRAASSIAPGFGHFQVCGSTIGESVVALQVGPDVLIGDAAVGCGANTIKDGDLAVVSNVTDNELHVIGNSVPNGNIRVTNNTGAGDKRVSGNSAPNGELSCSGNSAPFDGSNNDIAARVAGGQCTAASVGDHDTKDH